MYYREEQLDQLFDLFFKLDFPLIIPMSLFTNIAQYKIMILHKRAIKFDCLDNWVV